MSLIVVGRDPFVTDLIDVGSIQDLDVGLAKNIISYAESADGDDFSDCVGVAVVGIGIVTDNLLRVLY